ncbi:MAG: HEAT repeat domain-containing protein [Pirellulaceae bacterium]
MMQTSPRFAITMALAGASLLSLVAMSAWCQEQPKGPSLSVEEAIQALNSPNAVLQTQAAKVLVESGANAKPAIPIIIEILSRGEPVVRTELLFVLIELGPDAQEAVPVLIKLAASSDFHARYLTARALGGIGPAAQPGVPVLLNLLRDEVTSVRRRAAEALGNLGPEVAPEAVPLLITAMRDPLDPVREQAVLALGKFGELGKIVLPALQEAATSDASTVQSEAALSLWRLTTEPPGTSRSHNSPRGDHCHRR